MDRRGFLLGSMTGLLAGCAAPLAAQSGARTLAVRLHTNRPRHRMARDAIGLSFETSLLAMPDVFAAQNASLVALVRALAPGGVIRIGANDSEFCRWTPEPTAPVEPPFRWLVRPSDIDRLAGFLDACGWRVIYGINLANGDPGRAADEARYVARRLGERLAALQIGNEPDLYVRNRLRAGDYSIQRFIDEWRRYADAIRRAVPDAPIAGPDVAYRPDWVETFAERPAHPLRFLSCHYYATGPSEDPRVDIGSMLHWPAAAPVFERIAAAAAAAGIGWRITEGNSCYNHGKPGVSDTLASALWAVDTLLDMAQRGCAGMCFHCGPGRPYTVVDLDEASGRWQARPIYFGLLLGGQVLGTQFVEVDGGNAQLRVHAGVDATGCVNVVAVNVNADHPYAVTLDTDRPLEAGRTVSLHGPRLDAKLGLTLGDTAVDNAVSGQPRWLQMRSAGRRPTLFVPPASATLARFGP